jgi:DNA-binding transcriptional LysR family regulator
MDLDLLRAFVTFADCACNLTTTGARIGLSQPAVHARLAQLQKAMSATLYERRGRGLVLTSAGTHVLAWARDALEQQARLRARLHGEPAHERVVVACGEGALVHVVAGRVASFARQRRGALSFMVLDGPASIEAVRSGVAHAAVVAGAAAVVSDLRTESLLQTPLCVIAPRGHVLLRQTVVSVDQLLEHDLLLPPIGRPLRTTLEEAAAARGRSVRVAAELTGWEAVAKLTTLGVGVGIVNGIVTTRGLGRSRVRGLPHTTYRLVTRKSPPTSLLAEVIDLLKQASA